MCGSRSYTVSQPFSTLSSGRLAENASAARHRARRHRLSVPSLRVGWLKTVQTASGTSAPSVSVPSLRVGWLKTVYRLARQLQDGGVSVPSLRVGWLKTSQNPNPSRNRKTSFSTLSSGRLAEKTQSRAGGAARARRISVPSLRVGWLKTWPASYDAPV